MWPLVFSETASEANICELQVPNLTPAIFPNYLLCELHMYTRNVIFCNAYMNQALFCIGRLHTSALGGEKVGDDLTQ